MNNIITPLDFHLNLKKRLNRPTLLHTATYFPVLPLLFTLKGQSHQILGYILASGKLN